MNKTWRITLASLLAIIVLIGVAQALPPIFFRDAGGPVDATHSREGRFRLWGTGGYKNTIKTPTLAADADLTMPATSTVMPTADGAQDQSLVTDGAGNWSFSPSAKFSDGYRNIIDNSSFAVQQRVAAASTAISGLSTTTRAGQVADRWAVTSSVASNLNWQQVDTAGTQDTNLRARYYGSIISSSAGKKVMLSQFILGSDMAHLRGQKVRLSLKTNQKVGTGNLFHLGLLQLTNAGTVDVSPAFLTGAWSATTGTAPVWGTNLAAITPDATPAAENGTITGSYLDVTSVATTWTRSSCTFTVPVGAKNLVVVFFEDATGGTTDNISIAEVQLTQGADLADYVPAPPAQELARCQRVFCKSFPLTVAPAASLTVATAGYGASFILGKSGSGTALGSQIPVQFPVRMWKAPTVTLYTPVGAGAVVYRHTGTTPAVQGTTAVATNSTTDIGCLVTATNEATTNGAVGDLVSIHYTADAEFEL